MIKRTIVISNPARLRLANDQMLIESIDKPATKTAFVDYVFEGGEPSKHANEPQLKSVPIEDIGMLVLEHEQTTSSQGLIQALIENNAAVLYCDAKHMPQGLILPMTANHTFSEKVHYQINASEPLKKQLWKQTVQAKIRNQAELLNRIGKPYENLLHLASKVQSGDVENVEGRSAAIYWKSIFDRIESFTRGRFDAPPNNMLNYGYAILRAVVARSLVSSGMIPVLGIHHRNKYNAFCLADDIMEPYRPYVDFSVLTIIGEIGPSIPEELTNEIKLKLLQIPVVDVCIDGNNSPLMVGMQRTTASLMKCFEGEGRKILYPEF